MNFKEILQLIDKVADRGIAALEIEQAGVKIRIEGKNNTPRVIPAYVSDVKPDGSLLPAMPMVTLPAAPQAPANQEQKISQDAKHLPAKTFRVDDCSASIWRRERVDHHAQ